MFIRQVCVRQLTPEDVDVIATWGVKNMKRTSTDHRITFDHPGTLDSFLILCFILGLKAVDW